MTATEKVKQPKPFDRIKKQCGSEYVYMAHDLYGHVVYRLSDHKRIWSHRGGSTRLTHKLADSAIYAIRANAGTLEETRGDL